jgi:hypothetical protein
MNESDINQLKLLVSIRFNDLSSTINNILNGLEEEIIKLNKENESLKADNKSLKSKKE